MSIVYLPSIFRGLLLPGLDTYDVDDEADQDPTPPGSHWLFRPPPYVAQADLRSETVRICNPSKWKRARLDGYKLGDWNWRHVFEFPEGCSVPPRKCITLHCCPGKLSTAELDALPESDILWKNQDGSLRRKEVLNDGNNLRLLDKRDKEIASLRVPGEENNEDWEDDTIPSMVLPAVKRMQVLALRKLVLALCYLRLACIAVAASRVIVNPDVFLLFTALAHTFDILSRWASSQPGVPMDNVGVVLATMGDRLSAVVLLGALVVLDKDGEHSQLFVAMLCLDIASNWLQLSVTGATEGSRPLSGVLHLKRRGKAPDFVTYLMLHYPMTLTVASLGNETFLVWSYVVASYSLPHVLQPLLLSLPCMLQHAVLGALSLDASAVDVNWCTAVDLEQSDSATAGAPPMAAASAEDEEGWMLGLAWKVMWMFLLLCCAVRQLLSFIQALISMSTLSSEVIADAVGHAMQNKAQPYGHHAGGRGRRMGSFGGADGGTSNAARARSRSRGRSAYRDM